MSDLSSRGPLAASAAETDPMPSADLGERLRVRSMVHLAAEPIPFFWPMRNFIHHNPLYGLEHLPFTEAVAQGSALFHGRGYLERRQYQALSARGEVDPDALAAGVRRVLAGSAPIAGVDLERWGLELLTGPEPAGRWRATIATPADVRALLDGGTIDPEPPSLDLVRASLRRELLGARTAYEAVDSLYGSRIGAELDALVIMSCLDFFDEGQSVWTMPGRERGFFTAWRELTMHNVPLERHARQVRSILSQTRTPEGVILHVLEELQIPEDEWIDYFTRELARMHGWSGFIRWRTSAKSYHWARAFPGDLVDLVAIRMALALGLLATSPHREVMARPVVAAAIEERPEELYLRRELFGGQLLPALAGRVERAVARSRPAEVAAVFADYARAKRQQEAARMTARLEGLARSLGQQERLATLEAGEVDSLLGSLRLCEEREGEVWLQAMESRATARLLDGLTLSKRGPDEQRPFAQALFCIDTRSERLRRHLESVGEYHTFGIAGFFGVPVSFMELGTGSETHLSPVIVTPQNLVLEISATGLGDEPVISVLGEAVHELKDSVLSPFVTVEAIGLLFGFDMVGKTLAPRRYGQWRRRLEPHRPRTHLLLDKLDRAQADSLVRAVQRGVIVRAVEQELEVDPESVTDAMIRDLREAALEHETDLTLCRERLGLDDQELRAFVARLQTDYEINTSFAQRQLERLGRIGFSLDEQVNYAGTALRSIGLVQNFSRFVLLVGHGSTSANNPYESALDCGACGGNHGLVNARVLAQMANKPQVRRRLRDQGIDIPDDTWFLPALHNTTTDDVELLDLELIPPAHLVYIDRLRTGLTAASRLSTQERIPTLGLEFDDSSRSSAPARAHRNSTDWSQVRPEWGLARNAYFVIGTRDLTRHADLEGRAFMHSYDYTLDPRQRVLVNILTGPLVVAQWINMEHYFSTVDNDCYGSGSKVNLNVSGRFGVMSGNVSDLRTGLPAQTVLKEGEPYHEPVRLITVIEAPFEHARAAVDAVPSARQLVANEWIRLLVVDPTTASVHAYDDGEWHTRERLETQ
ncbi:DUF2309 domain-containing protein [Nocardioides sp.]|uniref:DUF2309 domain-containing protein n=1 Tax=Nocardioides sp. TaxID=35761 RepID=UPI0035271679